ncbi:MAG TPA: hypothetical protein VGQ53_20550 [Chitinophagaceae bacterium]|nr:hypothetical protein [Chitinophagaceae bacterium]
MTRSIDSYIDNSKSAAITNYSYDKDLIKRKILDIKIGIENLIQTVCSEKFFVDWYGAYDINPKHLVYWVCVESDKIKNQLSQDAELMFALRELSDKHQYPSESQRSVHIGFESQENSEPRVERQLVPSF